MKSDKIVDRAKGAFLGAAIGDALGATVEFMTAHEISHKFGVHRKMVGGGWLNLKPGQVTDDTEMSLCIARAIVEWGEWRLKAIAENFACWLRSGPVDVGATCSRSIRKYIHTGQLEVQLNEWDAGNGAAMRMAPVAIVTLGDETMMKNCAIRQARLTHNHPLSDKACVLIGRLIQSAILGSPISVLEKIAHEYPQFMCNNRLRRSSAYIKDTMAVVFRWLFSTGCFEDCLVGVVNEGGDADTTGAIAGMTAGSFYGASSFPKKWITKLDPKVRREIEALSEKLLPQ